MLYVQPQQNITFTQKKGSDVSMARSSWLENAQGLYRVSIIYLSCDLRAIATIYCSILYTIMVGIRNQICPGYIVPREATAA